MASYDNKLLKGDQLLVYSGLVKGELAGKIADPTSKTDGQILSYNASTGAWVAATPASPATVGDGVLTIQKNGTAVDTFSANATVNKTINILVPTNNNELTNGAGYQTQSQVNTLIADAISGLTGFHFEIVSALPAEGQTNIIYLVLKSQSETGNIYTEYAWINSAWEKLGDTSIQLEYLTNAEVTQIWNDAVAS